MKNLPDKPPKALPDIEVRDDGSTMERFASLTRKLLAVSHQEFVEAEKEYKARRIKPRNKST
jgi:hypothetical protein